MATYCFIEDFLFGDIICLQIPERRTSLSFLHRKLLEKIHKEFRTFLKISKGYFLLEQSDSLNPVWNELVFRAKLFSAIKDSNSNQVYRFIKGHTRSVSNMWPSNLCAVSWGSTISSLLSWIYCPWNRLLPAFLSKQI